MHLLMRHERHRVADKHIGNLRETALTQRAIQAALGPDTYEGLLAFTENYYVPNKDGRLFRPSPSLEARGASPVIPLGHDERYRLSPDFARFSLAQRTRIESGQATPELHDPSRYLARWETVLSRNAATNNELLSREQWSLRGMGSAAAILATSGHWRHPLDQGDYLMTSQPVLCFSADISSQRVTNDVLFHEYLHYWQATQAAVRLQPEEYSPGREAVAAEHEAYTLQLAVADTFRHEYTTTALQRYQQRLLKVPTILEAILADPQQSDPVREMEKQIDALADTVPAAS